MNVNYNVDKKLKLVLKLDPGLIMINQTVACTLKFKLF